jgi:tripartite-type tricarboxylate transporter receptor subunit TctC
MKVATVYRERSGPTSNCVRSRLTRRLFLSSCISVVMLGSVGIARPQDWPQRPVKLVVPFPPGGLTDGIARLVGQRLSERFGQSFIIENVAGGVGAIATRTVARAPADGYTLLLGSVVQLAVLPALRNVAYDPVQDYLPISNIASTPFVLMVHPSVPATTLEEFVVYVRTQSGKTTYSSAGVGSLDHLSMALFLKRAGIAMTHVPYKGGPQAITDLLAGHVTSYFGNRVVAVAQAKSGKVRLLAVSGNGRSVQFPAVPTVAESGYPGFQTVAWNGLMAPAGTPKAVVDRLASQVQTAMKDQKFTQSLINMGVDPIGDTSHDFAATIAADIARWAEAVNVAGIKDQP